MQRKVRQTRPRNLAAVNPTLGALVIEYNVGRRDSTFIASLSMLICVYSDPQFTSLFHRLKSA